ncbi:MAG: hypothetical protein HY811_00150 [Planctomycetes bacterium]|nr:hypothetical protein [Planctomycetota bacterium]
MKKHAASLIVLMLLVIAMVFTHADDKDSSEEQMPLIRISAPSGLKKNFEEITSDIFKILAEKDSAKQGKFAVRIEPKENIMDTLETIPPKKYDIFISSLMVGNTKQDALPEKTYPYKKLGLTPIAVITAKPAQENITDLSLTSLMDILSGKTDDWSKINPKASGKITVYATFRHNVSAWLNFSEQPQVSQKPVSQIIEHLSEDKNSLAIIPMVELAESDLKNLTILSIDGILPTRETLINGLYPYSIACYLVWKPEIAEHVFFQELSAYLAKKDILEKQQIYQADIILAVLPDMAKAVSGLIPKISKDAGLPDFKAMIKPDDSASSVLQADITLFYSNSKYLKAYLGKRNFHYYPIGIIPNRLIVSDKLADMENMSSEKLKGILSGKITDWSEISTDLKGKITVYSLRKRFFDSYLKIPPPLAITMKCSTGQIIDLASQDKNSLGIVIITDQTQLNTSKVKTLKIDGISPLDEEAIKSGKYPYVSPCYIVWDNAIESDKKIKKFLDAFKKTFDNELTLKKYNIYPVESK